MLEVCEEGLTIRSRLADFLDAPLERTVSRLSRGLERLGDALTSPGLFDEADEETGGPAPETGGAAGRGI